MRMVAVGAAFVAVALGATACAGPPTPSAARLLAEARSTLDATNSVHFSFTSTGTAGSRVTGGSGNLVRPDGLTGSFDVTESGLTVAVKIISKGTKFYVEPPFSAHYSAASPAKLGFGNPAQLLSRTEGLVKILAGAQGARVTGSTRISGELVDRVTASVPGSDIPVIPDRAPAKAVQMVAYIDPTSHQLRRVSITGPFVAASRATTYVVTITNYGEPVSVTLPST